MVPLLSELWSFIAYVLRPDDERPGGRQRQPMIGTVKALFWASLALLAGIGLGQLGG
jgi:hypothetical protein